MIHLFATVDSEQVLKGGKKAYFGPAANAEERLAVTGAPTGR